MSEQREHTTNFSTVSVMDLMTAVLICRFRTEPHSQTCCWNLTMRRPTPLTRRALTWKAQSSPRLHLVQRRCGLRPLISCSFPILRLCRPTVEIETGASVLADLQNDFVHGVRREICRDQNLPTATSEFGLVISKFYSHAVKLVWKIKLTD